MHRFSTRLVLVLATALQLVLPRVAWAAGCAGEIARSGCCEPPPRAEVASHGCCGPQDGTPGDAFETSRCACDTLPITASASTPLLVAVGHAVPGASADQGLAELDAARAALARRTFALAVDALAAGPPAYRLHASLRL